MTAEPPENGKKPLSQGGGESASIPPSATKAEVFARVMRQAAPFLAAAWTMIAAVVLGAVGGYWLDGRAGTRPWLAVAGTLLGTAVGMYELARLALKRPRGPQE